MTRGCPTGRVDLIGQALFWCIELPKGDPDFVWDEDCDMILLLHFIQKSWVAMNLFHHYVNADGTLNDTLVQNREILYTGTNGRDVERFYVLPSESYVFKPLTNDEQEGRERWVYEHVLPSLPPIYPRLLACSGPGTDGGGEWMILEDLGPLHHLHEEETMLQAVGLVAWWHALPTDCFTGLPLRGPKPIIEEMAFELYERKSDVLELCSSLGFSEHQVQRIYVKLEHQSFAQQLVLSHGDLHPGNYALSGERLMVLDWEHAHLNIPLWDVYHLIDMSHPLFPRRMTSDLRIRMLDTYLEQLELLGIRMDRAAFLLEYGMFAVIFSLWMLLLIHSDLQRIGSDVHRNNNKWSKEQLKAQLKETSACLSECAAMMEWDKFNAVNK
ncbi:aminoglycoside phosphotransferase family protein [Paenibacillus kribbensis]|uniref:aminoglycoside phosphotransferase family protein n=1 Tax=Paenibacillus kribbensis TaxID=172713 RepID=UPI002DBB7D62|nr:aminoglycoside phosphotransferase family protein [Paenibacillus kribbensis]MEC0232854.1 aminoglycoside phosphotransferase family protein [Paenibacillus kribbensis]